LGPDGASAGSKAYADQGAQNLFDALDEDRGPESDDFIVSIVSPVSGKGDSLPREQTRVLTILYEVASALVAESDLERIVQLVTDAGREVCEAAFGAFFYNVENSEGQSYLLYTLSGADPEAFAGMPMPRNTEIFAPTFSGRGVVRIDDVSRDPRYGKIGPFFGMPPGHLPVASYLAVPVVSKASGVLGGLFFGHPEPGRFDTGCEQALVTLAAQAAVAIENAKLQTRLQWELANLREAKFGTQRLAAIVQSSDDAIISKDLNGTIATWNAGAERMFGYSEEEAVGQPITMLFPPEHIDEEPGILEQIRKGRRIDHYETKRMRKDGSILDLSLTISPIFDENGVVIGASKIARDISVRKLHEEVLSQTAAELETRVRERTASLQEAVAQMEEFSYTVSHDLRAPLRGMSMRCRLLKEDYRHLFEADSEALETVDRLASQCAKLDRMIRDVLQYGRVARGELTIGPESLDLVVADTIANHSSLQPPAAIVAVEPLGTVLGHWPSLSQAVSNLMLNAAKFVPEGQVPEIRVWAERRDQNLRLWVEDNGIGVDPRYQHRLFTMFERIHPDMSYEGTGVGLAIVRRAIERMHGKVGVESDGITGSRFWVELPATQ